MKTFTLPLIIGALALDGGMACAQEGTDREARELRRSEMQFGTWQRSVRRPTATELTLMEARARELINLRQRLAESQEKLRPDPPITETGQFQALARAALQQKRDRIDAQQIAQPSPPSDAAPGEFQIATVARAPAPATAKPEIPAAEPQAAAPRNESPRGAPGAQAAPMTREEASAQLKRLLERYKAEEITPREYHEERSRIMQQWLSGGARD